MVFFLKNYILVRATSVTPNPAMDESTSSSSKNAKSIDDLIESLDNTTDTPKSSSKTKYFILFFFFLR